MASEIIKDDTSSCLLPQHLVYGTPFLRVVYDFLGLAVGLARMLYVHLCVYTRANPKVKPVLDTYIMTRIAN